MYKQYMYMYVPLDMNVLDMLILNMCNLYETSLKPNVFT